MEASDRTLRERGLRVTPQRAHLWRVLAASQEHLSAEELYERAGEGLPGLELSTVYRTLDALHEAGLVVESRLPEGPAVFEARAEAHPHLICDRCGSVSHPAPGATRLMLEAISKDESAAGGFEVRELHVVARGLCARCARDKD